MGARAPQSLGGGGERALGGTAIGVPANPFTFYIYFSNGNSDLFPLVTESRFLIKQPKQLKEFLKDVLEISQNFLIVLKNCLKLKNLRQKF